MRLVPILIAVLVAGTLYLLTVERQAVMSLAGRSEAAEEAPPPADAAGAGTAAREGDRVSVVATVSRARQVDGAVVLRGRTEAARQVEARAETAGKVVSEPLRKGASVAAGEVMCALDPGTRQAALAEAQAALAEAEAGRPEARARVAEAEARVAEAQINQTAASRLSEEGFASRARLASADAAIESARAGVAAAKSGLRSVDARIRSAEAAVATAETDIARLEISAPFAGVLETDTAELGALLQAGGLCATVIALDPIKLVGFAPETSVGAIETGARATARLGSGATAEGEVTFLSRSADPQTRTFRLEVEVPNPDLAIRDGQSAEIAIATAGRSAHLLPQSALTLSDGGDMGVRVVAPDGTAGFRPVELLRDTPEGVFVGGLPETARVILRGQDYVADGVALDVTWQDGAP